MISPQTWDLDLAADHILCLSDCDSESVLVLNIFGIISATMP